MMALAGQVFNITITSTGQATALTRVSQLLRTFERTLRDDLRHVQPGQSMLLIQGNPVNAYWTEDGPDADNNADPSDGYGHPPDPARERGGNLVKPRADVLMFFTARRGSSFVHPGVTSHLQQVVYGHADQGEYVPNPPTATDPFTFEPSGVAAFPVSAAATIYASPNIISLVPASRWHLARRSVLLVPTSSPPSVAPAPPAWVGALAVAPVARAKGLADERILLGETDVVGDFNYEAFVLNPGTRLPYFLPEIFDDSGLSTGNPFNANKVPFGRSRLDVSPPPQRGDRLGHYFVPNCATFKVEWTLDPRSRFVDGRLDGGRDILWFDPGAEPEAGEHPMQALIDAIDPAASAGDSDDPLDRLLNGRTNHPDGERYSLAERFLGPDLVKDKDLAWPTLAPDGRPNLVVFAGARRKFVAGTVVPEDIFPTALRVTIDVFDTERRLARPVRHVMVVPIGE